MNAEIDPRVVAVWTAAWARFRGLAPPQPSDGGWRVEVGWPEQKTRYVFAALDQERLRALALKISEPWVFLKVCAPPAAVAAALPAPWVLEAPRLMMTAALAQNAPNTALPQGYTLTRTEGGFVQLSVQDLSGATVASGNLWCSGELAVIDQIATDEAHRRRGLARALMGALSTEAAARGGVRAVLVATSMGQALYRSLGWSPYTPYTSAVRTFQSTRGDLPCASAI